MHADAAQDIMQAMEEVVKQGGIRKGNSGKLASPEMDVGPPLRIRDVIRDWLSKLMRGQW